MNTKGLFAPTEKKRNAPYFSELACPHERHLVHKKYKRATSKATTLLHHNNPNTKHQTHPLTMCHRTTCRNCGKASWAGCGNHIESALRGVRVEDRCPGWDKGRFSPCPAPPKQQESNASSKGGIFGMFK